MPLLLLLRPDAFAQKKREEEHSSAQEEGRKRIAILLPFPPSPDEGRGKSHIFCHLRLPPRPKVFPHTAAPIPLFPPAKFIAETRGGERCEGSLLAPFPRKTQYTFMEHATYFFLSTFANSLSRKDRHEIEKKDFSPLHFFAQCAVCTRLDFPLFLPLFPLTLDLKRMGGKGRRPTNHSSSSSPLPPPPLLLLRLRRRELRPPSLPPSPALG